MPNKQRTHPLYKEMRLHHGKVPSVAGMQASFTTPDGQIIEGRLTGHVGMGSTLQFIPFNYLELPTTALERNILCYSLAPESLVLAHTFPPNRCQATTTHPSPAYANPTEQCLLDANHRHPEHVSATFTWSVDPNAPWVRWPGFGWQAQAALLLAAKAQLDENQLRTHDACWQAMFSPDGE